MVGLSLVTCTAVFIMQPVGLSPSITVSAYMPYEIFHKTDLSISLPPFLVKNFMLCTFVNKTIITAIIIITFTYCNKQ